MNTLKLIIKKLKSELDESQSKKLELERINIRITTALTKFKKFKLFKSMERRIQNADTKIQNLRHTLLLKVIKYSLLNRS